MRAIVTLSADPNYLLKDYTTELLSEEELLEISENVDSDAIFTIQDANEDHDELIEAFGYEKVAGTSYFMRRHRLFELDKSLIELDSNDVVMFLLIDEEVAKLQATKQKELQRKTDSINQHNNFNNY